MTASNSSENKQGDSKSKYNTSKISAKTKVITEESKEAAKKKLLTLLSELKVEPGKTQKVESNLNLIKPLKRPSKQERFQHLLQKKKTPEEIIQEAAKEVATSLKGDPEKTLSDLNEKLQKLNMSKEAMMPDVGKAKENIPIDEEIGKNLMSSVEEVASKVVASTVPSHLKSKLTSRLMRLSADGKSPRMPIESLVKSLKVEKRSTTPQMKPPMKKSFDSVPTRSKVHQRIDLFGSPPLNIFETVKDKDIAVEKNVWQKLEEKNLKLLVQFAPANGFEEMIMWTEQGKHWKFPIDNETEMGSEENVGFNEHVFLENHLHGFPTKGPVRHFMELVLIGLSKNPYINIERKIENIDWFRDYFQQKDKEEILKEYGALA